MFYLLILDFGPMPPVDDGQEHPNQLGDPYVQELMWREDYANNFDSDSNWNFVFKEFHIK